MKNGEKEIARCYENRRPDPKGLKYGIIEATTRCQCACPGCYMVRRGALNDGEMTLNEAIRVLDLCRDYIGQELETMDILGGEPLLWPPLKDYIEILLKRGIAPWLFTNMVAITPSMAKWLREREIYITGKLNIDPIDASQLELQAQMIGRNVRMAKRMIIGIEILKSAGYQAPLFRVENLIRKKNIGLVPGYYRWCLENGIGTDVELLASGEKIADSYWEIAPDPKEIAEMINGIQRIRKSFGLEPFEVLLPHVFGSCRFFDRGLYFAVDGHIRACSNSSVILSRVTDSNPVRRAFESELICNRFQLTKEKMGEPCGSCDRWEKCRGGCRATVEGLGDPFGGYPLCPVPHLTKLYSVGADPNKLGGYSE